MTIPRLSTKEELILKLLTDSPGELYGLEMVHASKALKPGTIYVTLGRMEDKGYIESRKEERSPTRPGIPRRLYRITGFGRRVFAAWELAALEFEKPI